MRTSPTLFALFSPTLFLTPIRAFRNSIYVISNAEPPSLLQTGLTVIGQQRATECIPPIFANANIGLIVSCTPDPESGECYTAMQTATPVANSLNLPINATCSTSSDEDDDCVSNILNPFVANSTKAILIVWDFAEIHTLFEDIKIDIPEGDDVDDDDEGGHFDIITTIRDGIFLSVTSMNCAGIDQVASGTEYAVAQPLSKDNTKSVVRQKAAAAAAVAAASKNAQVYKRGRGRRSKRGVSRIVGRSGTL